MLNPQEELTWRRADGSCLVLTQRRRLKKAAAREKPEFRRKKKRRRESARKGLCIDIDWVKYGVAAQLKAS